MNSSDILEELRGAREELLAKAEGVPEPTLRTRPSPNEWSIIEVLAHHIAVDYLFELIVNSARVGVAKPDPRIFRLAAAQMGVEPPACVHIDDTRRNVLGAREAGFHAIHYRGHLPSLVSELQRLGMEW